MNHIRKINLEHKIDETINKESKSDKKKSAKLQLRLKYPIKREQNLLL